ncbi:MAG: hypothetical protein JWP91_1659 [Fibrobacteres bacterium]|nr:hypothetical protein [Fibrobacterota bacterium]
MTKVIAPIGIFRKDPDMLTIHWNDGTVSDLKARFLRSSCPCAVCVNEWTGEKMLDESRIPADIKPARVLAVGRYAMAIHWSDGHKTGIYSYDYLKKLEPGVPASGPGKGVSGV